MICLKTTESILRLRIKKVCAYNFFRYTFNNHSSVKTRKDQVPIYNNKEKNNV
jgi:hypothetical protein